MSSEQGLTIGWLQFLISLIVICSGLVFTIIKLVVVPVDDKALENKERLEKFMSDYRFDKSHIESQIEESTSASSKYMLEIQKQMGLMNTQIAVIVERTNK